MKTLKDIFSYTIVATILSSILFCPVSVVAATNEDILRIGGIDYSSQQNNTFYVLEQNLKVLEELAGVSFEASSPNQVFSTNETYISYVEQMIRDGMDGILICPTTDQVLPAICRMCEEAEMYWGNYFREIKDDEIRRLCESSPYYIGNTYEACLLYTS